MNNSLNVNNGCWIKATTKTPEPRQDKTGALLVKFKSGKEEAYFIGFYAYTMGDFADPSNETLFFYIHGDHKRLVAASIGQVEYLYISEIGSMQ